MIIETDIQAPTDRQRETCHSCCFACGACNGAGLGLRFHDEGEGEVIGRFDCNNRYQGYPGRLHGGIITMLMDSAMTHCLFLQGVSAVTARLDVKFRKPVDVGVSAMVRARLIRSSSPLFVLKAWIEQDGVLRAEAEGVFFEQENICNGKDATDGGSNPHNRAGGEHGRA